MAAAVAADVGEVYRFALAGGGMHIYHKSSYIDRYVDTEVNA